MSISPKISGLVITKNEEKNMASVIENLSFVDELIIVDSFSTDNTAAIARSYANVVFLQRPFDNFSAQRNFALAQASHEWILFLDADERITDHLKVEILETVAKKETHDAYFFYRKFYFENKPLHFSGWQTDKNVRLFKKSKAHYIADRLVHEILKVDGSFGILKHKLIHYSYHDFESYKAKMLHYGKLKAVELFQKQVQPNAFHFIIKPIYKFLYTYIVRLGILDGRKGIVICYLNALGVYLRYPELAKLHKKNKS